jgi:hypothetical protein
MVYGITGYGWDCKRDLSGDTGYGGVTGHNIFIFWAGIRGGVFFSVKDLFTYGNGGACVCCELNRHQANR